MVRTAGVPSISAAGPERDTCFYQPAQGARGLSLKKYSTNYIGAPSTTSGKIAGTPTHCEEENSSQDLISAQKQTPFRARGKVIVLSKSRTDEGREREGGMEWKRLCSYRSLMWRTSGFFLYMWCRSAIGWYWKKLIKPVLPKFMNFLLSHFSTKQNLLLD